MPREIKTSLVLDGEKAFNKGLQSIDRELRVMSSQLGALTSGYDKNAVSVENLSAQNKIMQDRAEVSRNKVKALETAVKQSEQAYADALKAVGQFTDEQLKNEKAGISAAKALETAERTMDNYKIKLANAQKQLNKNQKELDANTKAIEDFENAAKKSGKNTESIFDGLKKSAEKIAEGVKKAIPHIQAAATAAARISFKAAEKSVKAFADTTSAAMAASVKAVTAYMSAIVGTGTALFGLSSKAALAADDINTLATQTGLTTAEIQKMQYASDLIDVDLDTLTGSMAKLIKNMTTAKKGTGDAADAFNALGIAITNNDGTLRNNKDVFNEIIAALSKIENETQRDAYAMSILGKSAQDLNPLILGGADALEKLGLSAESAGLILGDDALGKLNAFNDSLDILKANAAASGNVIALKFSDGFKVFTDIIGKNIPAAASAFADLFDGSQVSADKFGQIISNIGTQLAKQTEKLAPKALTGFNNLITTLAKSFSGAIPSIINAGVPIVLNSFFGLVDGLIDQMPTLVPNIVTGSLVLFNGLIDGMNISTEKLISMLPDIIGGVIASVETNGPAFLEGSLKLFGNLLNGFGTIVDLIVPEIPSFIQTISEKLISNIPIIVRSVVSIVSSVSKSIIDNLPLVISSSVSIVRALADTLVTAPNIKLIINTAFDLLMTIVDTVVDNLDEIIDTAMTVVETLCTTLLTSENIEKLVSSGLTILIKLVNAIVDNIDRVFIAAEKIITSLADELTKPERLQTMIDLGIQLLGEIIVGLCKIAGKFSGFCYNLQTELWNTVTSIDFGSLGKSILDGIVAGLTNSSFGLHNMLAKFADNWVTGIKDILGIHSPSTVMRDKVGKFLASGIIVGFEEGMHNAAKTMAKAIPTDFAITPDVSVTGYSQFESYINGMNANYIPKAATYNNSQKTVQIYNHITIENARLDSSQDIQETAEALADETNRILAGVGKETS